jgi:hypothetical protein
MSEEMKPFIKKMNNTFIMLTVYFFSTVVAEFASESVATVFADSCRLIHA